MGTQFTTLNFYLLLLLDLGLVVLAHLLAYLTRFEGAVPGEQWQNFFHMLPYFSIIKLGSFFYFDLYRGMWRYTSLPDIFNIVKAVLLSSLLMAGVLILGNRFSGFSRSVFLLDGVYTILFIATLRVGIRLVHGLGWVRMPGFLAGGRTAGIKKKCVLLGAGKAGEKLVREIGGNPGGSMRIVAIFDDDPAKVGHLLHGVPIVGAIRSLPYWVGNEGVDIQEILIAMPSLSGEGLREVMGVCEATDIPFKTIPSLSEIANGTVSVKALRDVDYGDLLGRAQVELEMERIAGFLEGKVVLVTGAGGSIGSELCRQIIPFRPALLLLLDASEFNLYTIQMELEHGRRFTNFIAVLGNLQDHVWTGDILDKYRPEVIFHAAAYKHVPMLEMQPWQAVRNNVLATSNLVRAAVERGVERLLVVSTDKAVRPTSVMGATKRLTERIMQAHCGQGTRLMAVRFGNVVGSAGSVIPLFRGQIERGGPVTVTHPDVVRYFMTVGEACQLILQAGSMGEGGEIFVLKMGKPVKIAEMAKDLIRLSGKEPGREIEIKFIGLRPGEKLYEELIIESEGVMPTGHSQILVLHGGSCDWEYLESAIAQLEDAARAMQGEAVKELLQQVVPEYLPSPVHSSDSPGL